MTTHRIIFGDSRKMSLVPDKSIHLVITSPPYWQLKDYGSTDQIGFNDSYEDYIKKDDQYKTISTSVCDFNVTAGSSDPAEWEYEIKYFDEEPYDTDVLKTQLKEINVHYVGEVYILITTFDGYVILQVDNTTENQSTYGMFRDGKHMTLPAGTDLSSLETFYKYGGDT